jgi:SET domain-containing protein
MYCWFNHSCAPNAETSTATANSSAIEEQIATRAVKKGEEVFVSHIHDVNAAKELRREILKTWLGDECKYHKFKV